MEKTDRMALNNLVKFVGNHIEIISDGYFQDIISRRNVFAPIAASRNILLAIAKYGPSWSFKANIYKESDVSYIKYIIENKEKGKILIAIKDGRDIIDEEAYTANVFLYKNEKCVEAISFGEDINKLKEFLQKISR